MGFLREAFVRNGVGDPENPSEFYCDWEGLAGNPPADAECGFHTDSLNDALAHILGFPGHTVRLT